MLAVRKRNHCLILFDFAVNILYIKDRGPDIQHLVSLDVQEVASV